MTIRAYAGGAPERRALKAWNAAFDGSYRTLTHAQLHDRQRGLCYLCLDEFIRDWLNRSREPMAHTREHVFPRAAGGGGGANVLLAHRICNEAKADRWPFPCEVIYLAAIYATPHDAAAARAARVIARLSRNERRRAYIERMLA